MHSARTAEPQNQPDGRVSEDEEIARRSIARLLITGSTQRAVETLARPVHDAGLRAGLPFVLTAANTLPIEPEALRNKCSGFLDAAAGGSVLLSDVEQMRPVVQDLLMELLAGLEVARRPAATVRLISGTTVSLQACVAAGTFSEQLFYRLNIIHLIAGGGRPEDSGL